MSDKQPGTETEQTSEPEYECGVCGQNGEFGASCPNCKTPITAKRQYTLSEIRSGRAPDDGQNYRRKSGAAPRIVTDLPGAGGPGGQ